MYLVAATLDRTGRTLTSLEKVLLESAGLDHGGSQQWHGGKGDAEEPAADGRGWQSWDSEACRDPEYNSGARPHKS